MSQINPEYFSQLPRHKRLKSLRDYFESKQYEGRPDFFTGLRGNEGGKPAPLRQRKPCIIYPLPRTSVNQVVRFTFGESRFPKIGVKEVTADTAVAGETLSKADAEALEGFFAEAIERCLLKPVMRRIMRPGLAVGTVAAIYAIVDGLITITVANAEDIAPEFEGGNPSRAVTSARWAYQYKKSVANAQGQPEEKTFWFRQDITATEFIEYAETEVLPGQPVTWNASKRTQHGFGFCPVRWIRNLTEADSRDVDGASLYDNLLEEFDSLNFALSQRHRGINFWGVPQPWETGVEEDDGPVPVRNSTPGYSPADGPKHGAARERPAIPVGPDNKWSYRGKDVKLGLLETTGAAFDATTKHVDDIRARALEAMSVVLVRMNDGAGQTTGGEMSAKFLELAYEPLLALVDEMRHTWWPFGLKAILEDVLRIVVALKGEGVWIPGARKAAEIGQRFFIETQTGKHWIAPPLCPTWGDYFAAGPDEIQKAVDTATKAKGLVPDADRSKYVLPYFGRDDEEDALDELEQDKADSLIADADAMDMGSPTFSGEARARMAKRSLRTDKATHEKIANEARETAVKRAQHEPREA